MHRSHRTISKYVYLTPIAVMFIILIALININSPFSITGRATQNPVYCDGSVIVVSSTSGDQRYPCPVDHPVCDSNKMNCCEDNSFLPEKCISGGPMMGYITEPKVQLEWFDVGSGTAKGSIPKELLDAADISIRPGEGRYFDFVKLGYLPPILSWPKDSYKSPGRTHRVGDWRTNVNYGAAGGGASLLVPKFFIDILTVASGTGALSTCEDSDGSINHQVEGSVYYWDTARKIGVRTYDSCFNGISTEMYCVGGVNAYSTSIEEGRCCSSGKLCDSVLGKNEYIPDKDFEGELCGPSGSNIRCDNDVFYNDKKVLENSCSVATTNFVDGKCVSKSKCYAVESQSCIDVQGEHSIECRPGSCSDGICTASSIQKPVCDGGQGLCISRSVEECTAANKDMCDELCGESFKQQKCADSDESDNPAIAGSIYIEGNFMNADYCTEPGPYAGSYPIVLKTNIGKGILTEHYCEGDAVKTKSVNVGSGQQCVAGAIIAPKCADTDYGVAESSKGDIYVDGTQKGQDYCYISQESAEIKQVGGDGLREYYCLSGEMKFKDIISPADRTCKNGVMMSSIKTCKDSDTSSAHPDGKDYSKLGEVSIYEADDERIGGGGKDWCWYDDEVVDETPIGKGELGETYCEGSEYKEELVKVGQSEKCKNGRLEIMESVTLFIRSQPVTTNPAVEFQYSVVNSAEDVNRWDYYVGFGDSSEMLKFTPNSGEKYVIHNYNDRGSYSAYICKKRNDNPDYPCISIGTPVTVDIYYEKKEDIALESFSMTPESPVDVNTILQGKFELKNLGERRTHIFYKLYLKKPTDQSYILLKEGGEFVPPQQEGSAPILVRDFSFDPSEAGTYGLKLEVFKYNEIDATNRADSSLIFISEERSITVNAKSAIYKDPIGRIVLTPDKTTFTVGDKIKFHAEYSDPDENDPSPGPITATWTSFGKGAKLAGTTTTASVPIPAEDIELTYSAIGDGGEIKLKLVDDEGVTKSIKKNIYFNYGDKLCIDSDDLNKQFPSSEVGSWGYNLNKAGTAKVVPQNAPEVSPTAFLSDRCVIVDKKWIEYYCKVDNTIGEKQIICPAGQVCGTDGCVPSEDIYSTTDTCRDTEFSFEEAFEKYKDDPQMTAYLESLNGYTYHDAKLFGTVSLGASTYPDKCLDNDKLKDYNCKDYHTVESYTWNCNSYTVTGGPQYKCINGACTSSVGARGTTSESGTDSTSQSSLQLAKISTTKPVAVPANKFSKQRFTKSLGTSSKTNRFLTGGAVFLFDWIFK